MFLKKVKCFDRLDKVSYETLSEETKNWNLEKKGMHLITGIIVRYKITKMNY
jgi:hypothetical protein